MNVSMPRCPPPFLNALDFPPIGGFVDGRFCGTLPGSSLSCCLPCPFTDGIYPPTFKMWSKIAFSFSAAGFLGCLLLIITFIVLPPEKTRRHYLQVCLTLSVMLEALGFIVPLGVRPNECYDKITPHDMYSSLTCAFSGAFIIAGGMSITVWLLVRVISMHLQICWDIVPGKKFFYFAQALGWGLSATFFTTTITITGVSFRFGDACHINSHRSLENFWGPLLVFAGAATILQFVTFGYCMYVYLKNMWSDEKPDSNSTGLPSYNSSLRAHSARAVYKRVSKVLWLQWRSIVIVVFILGDIIFFAITFIYVDGLTDKGMDAENMQRIMPWLLCLFKNGGKYDKCFDEGDKILVSQKVVIAVLILIGIMGFQTVIMMTRQTMFSGWAEFFRKKLTPQREFVSLDAQQFTSHAKTYELLKVGGTSSVGGGTSVTSETPSQSISPPPMSYGGSPIGRNTPDYFSGHPQSQQQQQQQQQRNYRSPSMSFSSPKTPFQAMYEDEEEQQRHQHSLQQQQMHGRQGWERSSTSGRGGLGLHPPMNQEKGNTGTL